jgi:hypothetical protein
VKWKCLICGEPQKKIKRVSKNFCSKKCFDSALNKKCNFCKKEYKARTLSTRYCDECKKSNKKNRFDYKNRKKNKRCRQCNNFFYGTDKQILCPQCKEILPNPLIHHYEEIERIVICRICRQTIKKEIVKKSFRTLDYRINKYPCHQCSDRIKNQRRILKEQEKQRNGPIKRKNYYIKKTVKEIEESRTRVSENMKKNNPMFCQKTRMKVSKTFKKNIEIGKIQYKHGKNHHLWKGNRSFNLVCRSRLYGPWIKKVMTRDKFSCTLCNKKGKLQVHHVRFLRDIIKIVLLKNNIKDINNIDVNSDLYEILIQKVIKEHNLNDGITLCKKCHAEIDDRYRVKIKGQK